MPEPRLAKKHVVQLQGYDWPGNVRELQNVIERAVIRSRKGPLHFDLPERSTEVKPATISPQISLEVDDHLLTYQELEELERRNVLAVLQRFRWKISGPGGAAEFLGVHPATLSSRLRAMGIRRPEHPT